MKDGVDYFPKNSDFYEDDKVKLLRNEFGAKGMYLLDFLLCEIYRSNGYYLKWDECKCRLVSDGAGCGCTPSFTNEFVKGCIRRSYFNKEVFDMFGVITSVGIQRRFIRMLNSRTCFIFIQEYFLLDASNEKDVPQSILNKIMLQSLTGEKNKLETEKSKENEQNKIEDSKIEDSKMKKDAYGEFSHVLLTENEYYLLETQYGNVEELIRYLDEYIEMKGEYKVKSHYMAIKRWVVNAVSERKAKEKNVKKGPLNNFSQPEPDFKTIDEIIWEQQKKL